jgi:hypothetical protein
MRTKPYIAAALSVLTAAASVCPAYAADPGAGTGGAAFMKLGIGSARTLAMGRASVAVVDGSEAINWNPAGLAITQQREFAYSYMRYVEEIDAPYYMAYAHPLGRTVLGGNFGMMGADGFDVRDAAGRPLDSSEVRVSNGFFTASIARSFWYEKLFLGGSLKTIFENVDGTNHNTMAADFGAMLRPNSFVTFGFSTQNFGPGTDRIATVTRGGAAFTFGLLTASMEVNKASDGPVRVGIGGEFLLPEDLLQVGQVYLRAGIHSADDLGEVLSGDRHLIYPLVGPPSLSYGVGIFSAQAFGYGLQFDYTLISMGALGTADMLTIKMKF